MKAIFKVYWEPEMVFFVVPTLTLGTYDSPNFGNEWPRVFGITFLWLKVNACLEIRKRVSRKERRDGELDGVLERLKGGEYDGN